MTLARERFDRTVCDCARCRLGCQYMPGYLVPGDAERIAAHCGHADDALWLVDHFQASDGALVAIRGQLGRIPTIVPATKETDGTCVFLDDAGKCTVHAVAPFGCAYLDFHMPRAEGDARSRAGLAEILRDTTGDNQYAGLWQILRGLGRVALPLAERRRRMGEAEARLAGGGG